MVVWEKSWYSRKGIRTKDHKKIISYRNRNTGEVRLSVPSGKKLGYEKTNQHAFGIDPHGKDFKISRTPRVISPRR